MARPARVRMRSRKPGTRARRRLFGWKVRLPLATAVSPRCIWRSPTGVHAEGVPGPTRLPLLSSGLARNRRGPGNPVAAVSPTFGRLFEGTDVTSPGQTALSYPGDSARISWCHNRHTRTAITGNSLQSNVAERLAAAGKAVSFCQSRFSSERQANTIRGGTAARLSRQHRLTGLPDGPTPSTDMLRGEGDCPVHTCG